MRFVILKLSSHDVNIKIKTNFARPNIAFQIVQF